MSAPHFWLRMKKIERVALASALGVLAVTTFLACSQDPSQAGFNSALRTRYLYVASGSCYAGGAPVSTGNSTITKFDIETGAFAGLVADYNTYGNGDQPASVVNFDSANLLVAIENAAGRRIDMLNRNGSAPTTYVSNATALNGILRHISVLPDASILVTKASAIEKFTAGRARVTQGALAYIVAPAAPCATSTSAMTSTTLLPNGKIVFTHAAATPNNLVGIISSTGYASAANCLSGTAAPTTTSLPTSSLYVPSAAKLLVAYGSSTATSNVIQSYDVDLAAGSLSNEVEAFNDQTIVSGPTRMVQDASTGFIFVANGSSGLNNVEKFTLAGDGTLTKVGTVPFVTSSVYTRCITSLEVGP
ncbi:hypothetical protein BH10BDE1_BH10BDE1_29090 [soil metagenome]